MLQLQFAGSLGGLIALVEGQADLAGVHLWDKETDTYNAPFVRRLLPGRRMALLTLAHRRLGLITAPHNPAHIDGLADLSQAGVRFINRQRGSGTRVWLDAQLRRHSLLAEDISGYADEAKTHSQVAQAIIEEQADTGLAVESVAKSYGLHFIPLTTERYDLVIPVEIFQREPVQALADWLTTVAATQMIAALGGYGVDATGRVQWIEP